MITRPKRQFITYSDIRNILNTEYHSKKQWHEVRRTLTGPEAHIVKFEMILGNDGSGILPRQHFDLLLTAIESYLPNTDPNKRSGKTFLALASAFNNSLQGVYRKFRIDLAQLIDRDIIRFENFDITELELKSVIIPFLSYCDNLKRVHLNSRSFRGNGISQLFHLIHQPELSLTFSSENNIKEFPINPSIKSLRLIGCEISDEQSLKISSLSLDKLHIFNCYISHTGLKNLAQTQTIKSLKIVCQHNVNIEIMLALASNTMLQELHLYASKGYSDSFYQSQKLLASQTLKHLMLHGFHLDKTALTTLATNAHITHIQLSQCGLSKDVEDVFYTSNPLTKVTQLKKLGAIPSNTPFPSLKMLSLFEVRKSPDSINKDDVPCDLHSLLNLDYNRNQLI